MNYIDYQNVASAIQGYERLGYARIEVPWWVTEDIANVTKPREVSGCNNYKLSVNGKVLLASGEQAFLYLVNKGYLPPGMYQTVTPCFRNEAYDHTHSKQFLKLELINVLPYHVAPTQKMVDTIAEHARIVFASLAERTQKVPRFLKVVAHTTDPLVPDDLCQIDINTTVLNPLGGNEEIELGSYGARRASFASWIYGTGLAEPRFSKTMARAPRE